MGKTRKKRCKNKIGGDTYVPPIKQQTKTQERIITGNILGFINKYDLINKLDNFSVLEHSIKTIMNRNINKDNSNENNDNIKNNKINTSGGNKKSRKNKKSK